MKNVIVFDLDQTLVKCNLPEVMLEEYQKLSPNYFSAIAEGMRLIFKFLPYRLRRPCEYLELHWIPPLQLKSLCIENFNSNINTKVMTLLLDYKKKGFEIYIVTAGPEKLLKSLEELLGVRIFGSKTTIGIITKDIQDKKEIIYRQFIKEKIAIEAIYSDRSNDFSELANKNYLVDKDIITLSK